MHTADASPLAPGLALIFDLDGVIVDSMPVHARAWELYLEPLGVAQDLIAKTHGWRNDQIVREFLGQDADPEAVFGHGAAKERLYRNLMEKQLHQSLVPGIESWLERFSGAPLGLATNAERANVDFVLEKAGLRRHFRVIVDGSQVRNPKPAADIYLRAAEELGVAPANCIIFEDSAAGVQAGRSAGARVAGILTHTPLEGVEISARDFRDARLAAWLAQQRER